MQRIDSGLGAHFSRRSAPTGARGGGVLRPQPQTAPAEAALFLFVSLTHRLRLPSVPQTLPLPFSPFPFIQPRFNVSLLHSVAGRKSRGAIEPRPLYLHHGKWHVAHSARGASRRPMRGGGGGGGVCVLCSKQKDKIKTLAPWLTSCTHATCTYVNTHTHTHRRTHTHTHKHTHTYASTHAHTHAHVRTWTKSRHLPHG